MARLSPLAASGQASLQVPIPAMPWQPWSCSPRAQPRTETLAWQKEWGKRGTAKGNLNFCLYKSLLAPTTKPCAKRHPTESLAICCDWRLKVHNMEFWLFQAILALKYQIPTLQLNSYRACATSAASPGACFHCSHSCARTIVCRSTSWHSSGNLI